MPASIDRSRFLDVIGLAAWLVAGLPAWLMRPVPLGPLLAWGVFGALFLATISLEEIPRSRRLPLLALQSLAALATGLGPRLSGLEGILLVLVAAQLPFFLSPRASGAWVLAQNAVFFLTATRHGSLLWAVLPTLAYLTFQAFALYVTVLAHREAAQREELSRVHAELRAAQALLLESGKAAERSRIARDLHDVLGHHLTALSLRLEVAGHLAEGRARQEVEAAKEIARLLLSDVRGVVTAFREDDSLDLLPALRIVAGSIERPVVRLEVGDDVRVSDPALAETLLRSVQEIVTNAARHASARQLSVAIRRAGDRLEVEARDDGRGADDLREGNGLRGMRERLAAHGGRLEVTTAAGSGFRLLLHLPAPGTMLPKAASIAEGAG